MSNQSNPQNVSRRDLLKVGAGIAVSAVGVHFLPRWAGPVLGPISVAEAAKLDAPLTPNVFRHLAASDGWIYLPGTVFVEGSTTATWSPDSAARAPQTTYVFGFRDVTYLDPAGQPTPPTTDPRILAQKGHVQNAAPLLFFDELDNIQLTLTNLGFQFFPQGDDSHTIHWHGFRNALPYFDGVPEVSIMVLPNRDFPYFYHPHDPGTYMYHCHFDDVEHVQMGMTSVVFVRPAQNKTGAGGGPIARYNGGPASAPLGYVYNDGVAPSSPLSTAYDREFVMFLNEMWAELHHNDAHKQPNDFSEYHADFYLLNGRMYPDTLEANGGYTDGSGFHVFAPDPVTGYPVAPVGRPELQYNPISSLVKCSAGERVLMRFVNLGYTQGAMRLAGIPMHIVGKDATPLRGLTGFKPDGSAIRHGADISYITDTVYIGAGESYDAIFTAPPFSGGSGSSGLGYDKYLLYNHAFSGLTTPGGPGLGGQMTEIRVQAAGTLAPQTTPQT